MLAASDLIHLPFAPNLTEGGIAYACRSLASATSHLGDSPADRIRRIVASVAVELAFRHFLSEQGIPFNVLGATPFTTPDRYDVALGGHRCNVKSFFISRRAQIHALRQDPGLVLQAPALLPLDQFAAEGHKPDDIYLFAFLLGVTAASQAEVKKAIAARQPIYLIHPLTKTWSNPANWIPLEKLVLKSECERTTALEIGGMDAERNFVSAALELPPKKLIPLKQAFYSIAYLHAGQPPAARIGLYSPALGQTYLVPVREWSNIWVYGMEILLAGWLTHEQFRRKASVLNAGTPTFQYSQTRTKNLSVPVHELNPLGPLFRRVKEWKRAAAK